MAQLEYRYELLELKCGSSSHLPRILARHERFVGAYYDFNGLQTHFILVFLRYANTFLISAQSSCLELIVNMQRLFDKHHAMVQELMKKALIYLEVRLLAPMNPSC